MEEAEANKPLDTHSSTDQQNYVLLHSTAQQSTAQQNSAKIEYHDRGIQQDAAESVKESDSQSEIFKEIAIQSVDLNVATCSNTPSIPKCLGGVSKTYDPRIPIIIINSPTNRSPITIQPSRTFPSLRSLVSPMSLVTSPKQPQSLFLQALAKLNESSLSLAIAIRNSGPMETAENGTTLKSPELTPPASLTSAPPSYSFVLRQSAARRRPRLMGTFIPSPSFITRTPPPNYAAAFDIYVDTPIAPQPTRVYNFGFTSMPIVCPECGYAGLTAVTSKITICTHLCALLLCLFCCWVCAPLPYIMKSCKDVYHYCRNCRNLLGMYSPYNTETPYTA